MEGITSLALDEPFLMGFAGIILNGGWKKYPERFIQMRSGWLNPTGSTYKKNRPNATFVLRTLSVQ